MSEIRLCSSCKRSISNKDIESGKVVQNDNRFFCQNCSQNLGLKKAGQNENMFVLESLLNVVKNINRALTYEKSSWLNIIGAVIQCIVFGILIFAGISSSGNVQSTLLLALIFQVMALTFFVFKK